MKYYLDTEFIEDGHTIDLVSIGIVSEDGRELHLGNTQCKFHKASPWVIENVLLPMGFTQEGKSNFLMRPVDASFWKTKSDIKVAVAEFMGAEYIQEPNLWEMPEGAETPEVWADYGSYDWVALCQLFGTMMDLPEGFPMHINDLQQEAERLELVAWLPQQGSGNHDALEDAKHLKFLHQILSADDHRRARRLSFDPERDGKFFQTEAYRFKDWLLSRENEQHAQNPHTDSAGACGFND